MRRQAQQLGLRWPSSKCDGSTTGAHYYIEVVSQVFRCKYCWTVIWQPVTMYEARLFSEDIYRVGIELAYIERIEHKPRVLDALVVFNALRLVRHDLTASTIAGSVSAAISRYSIKEAAPDSYKDLPDYTEDS